MTRKVTFTKESWAAHAELRSLCKEVDALPKFAELDPALTADARMLNKLEIYEDWRARWKKALPADRDKLRRDTVMVHIGHAGQSYGPSVDRRLDEIDARDMLEGPMRHDPETELDRRLDDYDELVSERCFGPPRAAFDGLAPCKKGCAKELGVPVAALDRTAMRRLRAIAAANPPGRVIRDRKPRAAKAANPAVAPLLAIGLASFKEGFPEDPLYPDQLDLITIAERSGVAPTDFDEDADLFAAAHSAAAGCKLVPHPILATRRYSFADLIEFGRFGDGELGGGQATRKDVQCLRAFLDATGQEESELVPLDLLERIQRAIVEVWHTQAHGWRGVMKKWGKWNDKLRGSKPLPENFGLALRVLLREVGLTPYAAHLKTEELKGNLFGWVKGQFIPSVAAEPKVAALADVLRIPLIRLKSLLRDEWRVRTFDLAQFGFDGSAGKRLPFDFEQLEDKEELLRKNRWRFDRQDTVYGRKLGSLVRDKYSLPPEKWTEEMTAAWDDYRPKKPRRTGLPKLGEGPRPRDSDGKLIKEPFVLREKTLEMRQDALTFLFGYWHRDRELASDTELIAAAIARGETVYTPEGGIGIPQKYITPGLLAIVDLTLAFNHFRSRRTGKVGRGITMVMKVVIDMLRPKLGVVWRTPGMIEGMRAFAKWLEKNPYDTTDGALVFDITPFELNWEEAVEHSFDIMSQYLEDIEDGEIEPSRDVFKTMAVFIDHDRPMELYMKAVRAMLSSPPSRTISRHVHNRDCVQTLILVQTGLRTHNMLFTYDSGKGMPDPKQRRKGRDGNILEPTIWKVVEEGVTKWKIKIPASEFKNWYSPYFRGKKPYEFTLRDLDDLYRRLDDYVSKARPYLLRGRKSDAFFVTSDGTDMTELYAGANYRRLTSVYFIYNPELKIGGVEGAMLHGMHAVRAVIATHIVKVSGDLYLAAWAIQDSVITVERHYAQFIPRDKAKLASEILAKAMEVGATPSLEREVAAPLA